MTGQFNKQPPFIKKLTPPAVALICLAIMLLLNWLWPYPHIFQFPLNLSGLFLSGVGLAISWAAKRQFEQISAKFYPFSDPRHLVTDGLFCYSRNPMYLGLATFLGGVGVLLGSLSSLVTIGAFFLVINRWYIAYEEERLACIFGGAYTTYRARTPRWLSFPLLIQGVLTMSKTKFNFWLDIFIGVLFVIIIVSTVGIERDAQTWDPIHVVSGILLAIGCTIHLAIHWNWIKTVILTPKSLSSGSCRKRQVTFCLFGLLITCVLTGFVVLMLPDESSNSLILSGQIWLRLHSIMGMGLLGLIVYHLGLHWKRTSANTSRSGETEPKLIP